MARYLFPFLLLSTLLSGHVVVAQTPAKATKPAKASSDKDKPNLPRDPATGKVSYTNVIEVPGTTQAQLYQRAQVWLARNITASDGAAPIEDKANGSITAQGQLNSTVKASMYGFSTTVTYALLVYTKDGKCKYEFTNFTEASLGPFEEDEPRHNVVMGNGMMQRAWNRTRNQTDADIRQLAASLELAMKSQNKAPSDF